jgi:hypothetical protein
VSRTRLVGMCRSIKTLRSPDDIPDDDVRAAALQFVRKVSGYRQPSATNRAVFDDAVEQISASTRVLLDNLAAPRSAH